jgi:hypothetical protein
MRPVHTLLTQKHHFGSRGTIKKLSKHYIHNKPIAIRSNSLIYYKSYTSLGCGVAYLESEDSNAEDSGQPLSRMPESELQSAHVVRWPSSALRTA